MDFVTLVHECAPWVAHQTMAAIVRTESGFNSLAIGVNGARLARQPKSLPEAITTARWLMAHGYSIDLGLGQVNSKNLQKVGLTVEDAFDPCKNINAAARILHGNFTVAKTKGQGDQAALLAALSAYNTGSYSRGFDNGYVRKVVSNANSLPPGSVPYIDSLFPIALVGIKAQAQSISNRTTKTITELKTQAKLKKLLPLPSAAHQGEEVLDVFSRSDTLIKNP